MTQNRISRTSAVRWSQAWMASMASMLLTIALAPEKTLAQTTEECADHAVYALLDFWVGEWRVSAYGLPQGTNRIEKILGGCAIIEHWEDILGGQGKSLFYVDPVTDVWKQVWVTDHAFDEAGGVLEKRLVATGEAGLVFEGTVGGNERVLSRTTLSAGDDGTVRQHIERSEDAGESWVTTFDALYAPAEQANDASSRSPAE